MPVRVGLVGLGMMGAGHFKCFRDIPGAEIVAVCDVDPKKLAGDWAGTQGNIDTGGGTAADLSAIKRFDKFEELLADIDIDMVDLTLPTFLHAPLSIQALKAGKHVFCEKPMALTAALAQEMIATARAADRFLMIGHCLRFWPEYLAIKEMIDSGLYGPVRTAVFTRLSGTPKWSWTDWMRDPKRSGSASLDLHIHDVDTVLWYFGKPQAVSALGASDSPSGFNHIAAQYIYDDGPLVVAEGGWDFPDSYGFRMAAQIGFEAAVVDYDLKKTPALTVFTAEGAENPPVGTDNAYRDELAYFVDCVATGTPPSRVTAQDAADAVALVEAEVESARTGRPVDLDL